MRTEFLLICSFFEIKYSAKENGTQKKNFLFLAAR